MKYLTSPLYSIQYVKQSHFRHIFVWWFIVSNQVLGFLRLLLLVLAQWNHSCSGTGHPTSSSVEKRWMKWDKKTKFHSIYVYSEVCVDLFGDKHLLVGGVKGESETRICDEPSTSWVWQGTTSFVFFMSLSPCWSSQCIVGSMCQGPSVSWGQGPKLEGRDGW